MQSVSDNIMLGQLAPLGTGAFDLLLDETALHDAIDVSLMEDVAAAGLTPGAPLIPSLIEPLADVLPVPRLAHSPRLNGSSAPCNRPSSWLRACPVCLHMRTAHHSRAAHDWPAPLFQVACTPHRCGM